MRTVAELITRLQQLPQDALVELSAYGYDGEGCIAIYAAELKDKLWTGTHPTLAFLLEDDEIK